MKHRIILITLLVTLILITSGCSATYTMQITEDSINESLTIKETYDKVVQNAYYNAKGTLDNYAYNTTYVDNYISQMQTKYKNYYINKENFDRDNFVIKDFLNNSGYIYYLRNEKKYSQKNNLLINNIIKDSLIINDNNIILHIDEIPNNLLDGIDSASIVITTELNVLTNNADNVENSIYTWNFTKDNYRTKKISINIQRPVKDNIENNDNTSNATHVKKSNHSLDIIIIIGIYIVIIIAVVNLFNKKKKLF